MILSSSRPPSPSLSPLGLSPPNLREVNNSDPSLPVIPADGDIREEFDESDSHWECPDPGSKSPEAPTSIITFTKNRDRLASKRFFYEDEEALN